MNVFGKVHLGYIVGSGEPLSVPLRNTTVTGQTQDAGKTTLMEGLIVRSGKRAITFVTKRGERGFQSPDTMRIPPYFGLAAIASIAAVQSSACSRMATCSRSRS